MQSNGASPRTIDLDSPSCVTRRKLAIRVYFALSAAQAFCGVGAYVSSGFSIHLHENRFPYFVGGFSAGTFLLVSSLLAFRVYNKGPYFTSCEVAKKEVLCAANWHRALSFFMFFVCLFSVATIWIYGLCVMQDEACSYESNIRYNRVLAGLDFGFGCVGIVSSAVGVSLIRHFGKAFGLVFVPGRSHSVRFVGNQRAARDYIAHQNDAFRQQMSGQCQHNSDNGCFTNLGFEPISPPPYCTLDAGISVISDGLATQYYSFSPPKYDEIGHSMNTFTSVAMPVDPPPTYTQPSGAGCSWQEHTQL